VRSIKGKSIPVELELASSTITGASIIGSANEPAKEDDAVVAMAAANNSFFIFLFPQFIYHKVIKSMSHLSGFNKWWVF
jgi:hypothetical protein